MTTKVAAARRASYYSRRPRVAILCPGSICDSDLINVRFRPLYGLKSDISLAQQIALYSITSSARARSVGGTSMPSARAVGRLMTNSNLVDCTTGRSAGLAPLRILPV
jgi:hypothetical protein